MDGFHSCTSHALYLSVQACSHVLKLLGLHALPEKVWVPCQGLCEHRVAIRYIARLAYGIWREQGMSKGTTGLPEQAFEICVQGFTCKKARFCSLSSALHPSTQFVRRLALQPSQTICDCATIYSEQQQTGEHRLAPCPVMCDILS